MKTGTLFVVLLGAAPRLWAAGGSHVVWVEDPATKRAVAGAERMDDMEIDCNTALKKKRGVMYDAEFSFDRGSGAYSYTFMMYTLVGSDQLEKFTVRPYPLGENKTCFWTSQKYFDGKGGRFTTRLEGNSGGGDSFCSDAVEMKPIELQVIKTVFNFIQAILGENMNAVVQETCAKSPPSHPEDM